MGERTRNGSAVLTLPNLLSALRIAAIPFFVWLIVRPSTTAAGLLTLLVVLATDWVDGAVARATGRVTELGKVLDPLADRLCIAAGLIALTARGAFPLEAALPILIRDGAIVLGALVLAVRGARIEVRFVGKMATFALMTAIGCVAWGTLGYPLAPAFLTIGWLGYALGLIEYGVATVMYVGDLRRAIAGAS
jgi:cardiolipin synthase (CMP-forming)